MKSKDRRPHKFCNYCTDVLYTENSRTYCVFNERKKRFICRGESRIIVPHWCPLDKERKTRYEMIESC